MTRLFRLFREAGVQGSNHPVCNGGIEDHRRGKSITRILNDPFPLALMRTAKFVHPEQTLLERLDRLKYVFRGLCSPIGTSDWFKILKAPQLGNMLQRNPHMLSKLQRPYLHVKLTGEEKIAALKHDYDFVLARLKDDVIAGMGEQTGFTISQMDFAEDGRFSLRLYCDTRFEKEGEICLGLFDDVASEFLFTITFCVIEDSASGGPVLFVGGLQGHKFENQRERIVSLTRSMFGMRPKGLLVFGVQRLAQMWGLKSIVGVGDSQHIYRKFGRRKDFNASYDAFWEDCDGVRDHSGNYAIPAEPQTRNMAELPSGKRSLYRKRYAMLSELGFEIQRSLAPARETYEVKQAESIPLRLLAEPVHF